MKKLIVLVMLILIATPAFATNNKVTNVTNVTKVTNITDDNHNAWDYGVFADVVLYEAPNLELGVHSTYAYEDNETRVYVGGKYYFNRATYQKK